MLYFSVGADFMLISNLWTEVVLHNGAKVTVVDFMYTGSEGTRNGGVPETAVVQFRYLSERTHIETFLEGYEQSVLIPMKRVEWKHGTLTLMPRKFKLILSWDTTIHKSQGLALEMAIFI